MEFKEAKKIIEEIREEIIKLIRNEMWFGFRQDYWIDRINQCFGGLDEASRNKFILNRVKSSE